MRAQPRARRTLFGAILLIPSYVRMLFGLMRDARVSRLDRLLVVGALAYVISPLDFIPDVIPFFGQVDDVFFVMLAVQRLMDGAEDDVLLDHWRGNPDDLSALNVSRIVGAASFFLPAPLRRRLRQMARKAESDA
jgi:uncharacterized membrane protein YkvA (DUF1232 family)